MDYCEKSDEKERRFSSYVINADLFSIGEFKDTYGIGKIRVRLTR